MKVLISIILMLLTFNCIYAQNNISTLSEADIVLAKVFKKLNSLKYIKYDNERVSSFASENIFNTSKWSLYFDFQTKDTLARCKFQIENETGKQIFTKKQIKTGLSDEINVEVKDGISINDVIKIVEIK